MKKNIWQENKWLIIIGIIFSLILLEALFLFPCSQQTISNFVQAEAVITLVLVTCFYARQTKRLVEEQERAIRETRKKTQIDFLERRIKDFYHPYLSLLDDIVEALYTSPPESSKAIDIREELMALYEKRSYMTSISRELIADLNNGIVIIEVDDNGQMERVSEMFKATEKIVREFLINEWNEIEREIKEYYSSGNEKIKPAHPNLQG